MEINSEIILHIDSLAFEGKGVARHQGKVFFVEGGVPGDVLKCVVKKSKKSYSEAKIVDVINRSQFRVEPKCKYFGTCGGCKLQNVTYEAQLKFKHQNVVDAFERIAGLKEINILPVIGSDKDYLYRNKMEFTFSNQRWLTDEEIKIDREIKKTIGLGLHIPKRFDKVLDIDECWLQSSLSNKILNVVRQFVLENQLTMYTTKTHEGYLRHLMIRTSNATGEIMVNLVTTYDKPEVMEKLTSALINDIPEITTIVNNITQRKSLVAFGDIEKVYYGKGFILEKLGKYTFQISANSFFQTNTPQAEKLYKVVKEFANLSGKEVVYDLYCGTGSISIYISDQAEEVIGIEIVESAIDDAKKNSLFNKIDNCQFIIGDLKDKLTKDIKWLRDNKQPDIIILDPPRSGTHPKVIEEIVKLQPKSIIYVSCNPTTQAGNIKNFTEFGYKLQKVQPVDMFPQTYHIEAVALLTNL